MPSTQHPRSLTQNVAASDLCTCHRHKDRSIIQSFPVLSKAHIFDYLITGNLLAIYEQTRFLLIWTSGSSRDSAETRAIAMEARCPYPTLHPVDTK